MSNPTEKTTTTIPKSNLTTQAIMLQQPQIQLHHTQLQAFWQSLQDDMKAMDHSTEDFMNHHEIPVDDTIRVIGEVFPHYVASFDSNAALTRAGEIFLLELALRAFQHKTDFSQSKLAKEDILAAVTKTEHFDFLTDAVIQEHP